MKTILFPTDYSENAMQASSWAAYFAQLYNAKVIMLHVYNVPVSEFGNQQFILDDVVETAKKSAEDCMKDFETQIRTQHPWMQIESKVAYGYVIDTIVNFSIELQADYIVMGTKGAGGMIDKIIGTHSMGVIERASCPVFVVPEKAKADEVKDILYAADYEGDEKKTIKEVLKFSSLFNAATKVVHVHDTDEVQVESLEKITDILRDEFKNENIKFRILHRSDVPNGLDHYIENASPDIIVLAPHRRGYWANIFHKSVTKHFALESKKPILALHKN